MGQQGSISLEERDREISLIRTVSEILMACSGNGAEIGRASCRERV